MKFDGVIGKKNGCQYSDLPHFVRDLAEFKADSDVIIAHTADRRIEHNLKDIDMKIDERAEKLISKNEHMEKIKDLIEQLQDDMEKVKEACGFSSQEEDSESDSNSQTSSSSQVSKS